jgi:hypothetical protein
MQKLTFITFLSLIVLNVCGQEIKSVIKDQLKDYLDAVYSGNVDKAISYQYPDMFVWMKKTADKLETTYTIEDLKKEYSKLSAEMRKLKSQGGVEFSWTLDPIEKKAEYNNYLIYTSLTSLIVKNGYDEIKSGDVNICISSDRGKTWKFISKSSEGTLEILRMRFPEYIVQQILN